MLLDFDSPPIEVSSAHTFAAFFACSYVGSFYIWKKGRLSSKHTRGPDQRGRDDPNVIRARLLAASVSTVISMLSVTALVWSISPGYESTSVILQSTIARLGLTLNLAHRNATYIIFPCLIVPVLFAGPLYASYLSMALPFQKRWSFRDNLMPMFTTWVGVRNYIIGPITEEVVFRACMLAVYHMSGVSRIKMIFFSPLAFGAAHLHHAWEAYNRYGRTNRALQIAIMQTLFQLAYTSLFGFHCAFLFLRTGSLLPPVVSHFLCNVMGFPQYTLHIQMFPKRRLAIQAAYLLGIVGYIYTMRRWTRTEDSLFWPAPGKPGRY